MPKKKKKYMSAIVRQLTCIIKVSARDRDFCYVEPVYHGTEGHIHSKTPIPAVTTQHCDYMVTTSAVTMLHSDYMVTTTVTM